MGSRSRFGRWLATEPTLAHQDCARRRWLVAEHAVRCSRSAWFTEGWEPEAIRRFQADADQTLEQLVQRRSS